MHGRRKRSGWVVILTAMILLAGLSVLSLEIAAAASRSGQNLSGQADGGGFPSPTPTLTATPVPTVTPTSTLPPAYPAEIPTQIAVPQQQAFAPQAQPQAATRSSPSLLLLCLPFAAALLIVVAILATWLRRRGHTP